MDMKLKRSMKKENLVIWLVVFLVVSSVVLLANYKGVGAGWSVIEPEKATLVGIGGTHISIQGDYCMDAESIEHLKAWLHTNDFQQDQTEGEDLEAVSYRGIYKHSLPIIVTFKTIGAPETTIISVMYYGSGLTWFLDKKIQMAEVFSNALVEQCTKGVVEIDL
uniref:Uncharacterized protein n=1 Tax=uncultured Thiotrichaceae bacterium TaxID=298394 RepID=A0A6S6UM23_9GAMM|nr:MAG: Unknown protein [uncultured Thiotrichaceae bacterium]